MSVAPGEPAQKGSLSYAWMPRWAQHPFFNFIGAIASIIAIPITFWMYFDAKPSRDINVVEPAMRSVFVTKDTPAVLNVTYAGEPLGGKEAFATQVAVWNCGNLSIRPDNVLAPVRIRAPEGTRIIEARISRPSRDVCGIAASIDAKENAATLQWKILEPGDGAVVSLLLVGDHNASITAGGIIENGRNSRFIHLNPLPSKEMTADHPWKTDLPWSQRIYVVLMGVFGVPGLISTSSIFMQRWRDKNAKHRSVLLMVQALSVAFFLALTIISIGSLVVDHYARKYEIPSALLSNSP